MEKYIFYQSEHIWRFYRKRTYNHFSCWLYRIFCLLNRGNSDILSDWSDWQVGISVLSLSTFFTVNSCNHSYTAEFVEWHSNQRCKFWCQVDFQVVFYFKEITKLFKPFAILMCVHKGDYVMKYNLSYEIWPHLWRLLTILMLDILK